MHTPTAVRKGRYPESSTIYMIGGTRKSDHSPAKPRLRVGTRELVCLRGWPAVRSFCSIPGVATPSLRVNARNLKGKPRATSILAATSDS